ncbi:hypothetical protein Nepgr_005322 [Nepenthes gracilis]|uniref:Uncharacterized protein n=1 Tax=Nepenthes gracilis TaxID=150966 RepID=A0AAD3S2Z3_NEPGR|nr:hypothetical protein Nepgr_005322 [Nepenthes gracilis]
MPVVIVGFILPLLARCYGPSFEILCWLCILLCFGHAADLVASLYVHRLFFDPHVFRVLEIFSCEAQFILADGKYLKLPIHLFREWMLAMLIFYFAVVECLGAAAMWTLSWVWVLLWLSLAVDCIDDDVQPSTKLMLEWLFLYLVSGCCALAWACEWRAGLAADGSLVALDSGYQPTPKPAAANAKNCRQQKDPQDSTSSRVECICSTSPAPTPAPAPNQQHLHRPGNLGRSADNTRSME